MRNKKESGYIALVSAVIISILVLVITLGISSIGFFGRSNILNSEYKERSFALAEACADSALLKLSLSSSYAGGENINVGQYQCSILAVESPIGQKVIKTTASFQNSVTNLKITVKNTDLSIISWEEFPNF